MKLKKVNAVLALLSTLTLFVHVGYSTFAYLTMYYNPSLKLLTAMPFMILCCLHAVCGMCTVFLQGDGTRLDCYPKKNAKTVVQRVTAALTFPLLILHLRTFALLESSSADGKWPLFALLIFAQVLFFTVIFAHTAVSFSRALITLGVLKSAKAQKTLDRIACCVCAAAFLIASFAIVRSELLMFLPK